MLLSFEIAFFGLDEDFRSSFGSSLCTAFPIVECSESVVLCNSVSVDTRVESATGSSGSRNADSFIVRLEGGRVELGKRCAKTIPLAGDGGSAIDKWLDSVVDAAIAVILVSTRGGSNDPYHSSPHKFHSGLMFFKACGIFNLGPPTNRLISKSERVVKVSLEMLL